MRSVMGVSRILAVTMAALAFCLTSCGGGGGGGTIIPGGVNATFTPLAPTPPVGSLTMQAGAANADVFTIRVVATGVGSLFGTAFHVIFNPASAAFVPPAVSSSSVLNGAGTPFFDAVLQSPGNVAVVASRIQDQLGTVPGISTSGDVLVLTFRATNPTGGNTFSFGNPRQACSPVSAPGCTSIPVVWSGGTLTTH
jgi:hypothetical protein